MLYDICCIGHITLDKVVTGQATVHMPGGTSFYFSHAMTHMDVHYLLVTALAETEIPIVRTLQDKGITVKRLSSTHTVYFENIYSATQEERTQRVLQQADPFTEEQLKGTAAKIFHLGPLLAGDIPAALIKALATNARLSLDVQGFLRTVKNNEVLPVDWTAKKEILPHIHFLKASEEEMKVLTGYSDVRRGARALADGVPKK